MATNFTIRTLKNQNIVISFLDNKKNRNIIFPKNSAARLDLVKQFNNNIATLPNLIELLRDQHTGTLTDHFLRSLISDMRTSYAFQLGENTAQYFYPVSKSNS